MQISRATIKLLIEASAECEESEPASNRCGSRAHFLANIQRGGPIEKNPNQYRAGEITSALKGRKPWEFSALREPTLNKGLGTSGTKKLARKKKAAVPGPMVRTSWDCKKP
jgi:hypothetical protein